MPSEIAETKVTMKKSLGRRKIEIRKLNEKSRLQVTFSKRRAGLFRKAAELSILCGAEIAILVFSPAGKMFTFGHPSVESLMDRFLTGNVAPPKPADAYLPLAELNATANFDVEKRAAAERLSNSGRFWWDEPIERMRIDELKPFRLSLLELRAKLADRLEKLTVARMEGCSMHVPPIDFADNLEYPPLQSFHLPGPGNCSVATELEDLGLGFL